MADLLPSSPDTSAAEGADPRVIGVDSDGADDLIAALSSGTARALLAALHDEPANPAKLAESVDTTIQNAQYHLGKLEDAGLIEVVDTVYSEKGREMQVYAPSDRPLVVVAGREEETTGLQAALSRLLGAFAALALGSALVQQVLGDGLLAFGSSAGSDPGRYEDGAAGGNGASDGNGASGGDGGSGGTEAAGDQAANATASDSPTPTPEEDVTLAETTDQGATSTSTEAPAATPTEAAETPTPAPEATPTPAPEATSTPAPDATGAPSSTPVELFERTATEIPDLAAQAGPDVAPGLLFFAGGAAVIVAGFAYRYASRRR